MFYSFFRYWISLWPLLPLSKCKNEVWVYSCFASPSNFRKQFLKDWGWSLVNRLFVWVLHAYRVIPETQWSILMEVNRHSGLQVFHVVFARWGLISEFRRDTSISFRRCWSYWYSCLGMHAKYCLIELLSLHMKCKLCNQSLILEVFQMRHWI